jgi:hypothetical protein
MLRKTTRLMSRPPVQRSCTSMPPGKIRKRK